MRSLSRIHIIRSSAHSSATTNSSTQLNQPNSNLLPVKNQHQITKMNKQIIVVLALFAFVAVALANEYQQHYEQHYPEEKKFIQLPALKLKLNLDKLTFKIPNLESIFRTHREQPHYPQHY